MVSAARGLAARALYAGLFCVALPLLLLAWARALEGRVGLAVGAWSHAGAALAISGLALMAYGMISLLRYGRGLPMNVFPPPALATRGAYALVPHPIYVGAGLAAVGTAAAFGSSAGLHVVAPVLLLSMAALVLGHERPDLARRFGGRAPEPWLALPRGGEEPATVLQKLGVASIVLVPWLVVYEWIIFQGPPAGVYDTVMAWERSLPVVEWTEIFYAACYPVAILTPFATKTRAELRRYGIVALWASALGLLLQATLPLMATPRPFVPATALGELILWERSFDGPMGAFPSFHVIWAVVGAHVSARRAPRRRAAAHAATALIAASCVTTGAHSVADVLGGYLVAVAAIHYDAVWRGVLAVAERTANSWREWRRGPVRIINHGVYAGLGAVMAAGIATLFVQDTVAIVGVVVAGLLGAALWAQWLEGGSVLLRPFGYYGALLGAAAGCAAVSAWREIPLPALGAAFAVGAPWVQACGRIRCLVQGCCHGRKVEHCLGIRYSHPSSRVTHVSGLAGVPLHATQVYSIAGNVAIGLLLARLAWSGAHAWLIAGLYLILSGLARFIEEGYRGEIQTRVVLGLPVYQWLAILAVAAGAVATVLPGGGAVAAARPDAWHAFLACGLSGLLAAAAMGLDFPRSRVRFARLSG